MTLSAADMKAVAGSGMCYYNWAFANTVKLWHKPCVVRWSAEISRRSEKIKALLKIGKNERGSPVASALKG
jgi:hypothetical protein